MCFLFAGLLLFGCTTSTNPTNFGGNNYANNSQNTVSDLNLSPVIPFDASFAKDFGTAGADRPDISIVLLEQRVHELVNVERVKNNLNPMDWNPALNQIARIHSNDMAKRNYFEHNDLEYQDHF